MNGGKRILNEEATSDVEMENFKRSDNSLKVVLPSIPLRTVRHY
jgi:hypothetical protein